MMSLRRYAAPAILVITAALGFINPAGQTAGPPAKAGGVFLAGAGVPAHTAIDLATGKPAVLSAAMMAVCGTNALCFYDYWSTGTVNYDYFGSMTTIGTSCRNLATSMKNKTSYIWNNSSARVTVHTGDPSGCLGVEGTVWAHSDGNMSGAYNNSIDAFRLVCYC